MSHPLKSLSLLMFLLEWQKLQARLCFQISRYLSPYSRYLNIPETLENSVPESKERWSKLKESKCNFWSHICLGHLISGQGIEPLPEKLESFKGMPPPRNPKEVKQFLGLVGCYHKFIPPSADIARPPTSLTKKDISFSWTNQC